MHEAFASAWEAADAVPEEEGADPRALANARRAAAEAALKRSLGGLGLNVQVGRSLGARSCGGFGARGARPRGCGGKGLRGAWGGGGRLRRAGALHSPCARPF